MKFNFQHSWKCEDPHSVVVSSNDVIYVSHSHQIQCFDSMGNSIGKWGHRGNGDGEFDYPTGLAIDVCDISNKTNQSILMAMKSVPILNSFPPGLLPICLSYIGNEYLYICDSSNHRIQKFDITGVIYTSEEAKSAKFVRKWGNKGYRDGKFNYPSSCAIAIGANFAGDEKLDSLIYVTDYDNNRIQVFDGDGKFIRKWGSYGSVDGEFSCPSAVSVSDRHGLLYVADAANDRVQCFDLNGKFIRKWGLSGNGNGMFDWPNNVMIDDDADIVYVCDWFNNCVQAFAVDGKFIKKFDKRGSNNAKLEKPKIITKGTKGSNEINNIIYIADNRRIIKIKITNSSIAN